MRLNRLTIAGMTATTVLAAGFLSGTANSAPPDESTCYDLGLSKDNLLLATEPETARSAADTLENYSPPDETRAAIEHFVTTVGAQPDDPALDANRTSIANWLKGICPMLNTN